MASIVQVLRSQQRKGTPVRVIRSVNSRASFVQVVTQRAQRRQGSSVAVYGQWVFSTGGDFLTMLFDWK